MAPSGVVQTASCPVGFLSISRNQMTASLGTSGGNAGIGDSPCWANARVVRTARRASAENVRRFIGSRDLYAGTTTLFKRNFRFRLLTARLYKPFRRFQRIIVFSARAQGAAQAPVCPNASPATVDHGLSIRSCQTPLVPFWFWIDFP